MEEAARRLGISVSTVRRRIEGGSLVGEREVIGGSKERYRVRMPQEAQQAPDLTLQAERPQVETGDASVTPQTLQTTNQDASSKFDKHALNILDMLLSASLDAEREQASRIEELIERAVRAEATAETLKLRVTDLAQLAAERQAELEELRDRERRPWFKRLLGLS